MKATPSSPKLSLLLDFADALGRQSKTDNFLHNLLARHYDVQIVDDPEVLIFTHYGHRNRLYSCKKIFYTQERYFPDWKNCDAAVTSAFCKHPRAYYFPFFAAHRRGEDLVRSHGFDPEKILRENRGFCSYMHKYEDRSVAIRTRFFHALNRRAKVDAFGPARNNTGFTVPGVAGEAKQRALRRCRFHVAFENRLTPGWTTEKFTDAFEANTVPIYWGDEHALQWFNPKAFINVRKFRDFGECCDFILHLENTPSEYLSMLAEPPLLGNRVPEIYSHEKLLEFLVREIERVEMPVARRRWFFPLTKWRLVRRDRVHEDGSRSGPPPFRRGFPDGN
jgi:alpha(1,3/1,4) fucosyltransferase